MADLFKNTHDALVFAFNYSTQQYALSPMSKMSSGGGTGSGNGLVSLDGAGQCGLIRVKVQRLSSLHQACIVARYAPRFEQCPCCENKDKMADEYREAIAVLTEWAIGYCKGLTLRNMRGAIVRSFFERGISISATAKELNVAKATAYDQKARIHKELKLLDGEAQLAIGSELDSFCGALDEIS